MIPDGERQMKIADSFSANGGFVVVGSDPTALDISDDEFQDLRARMVALVAPNGERRTAKVAEVTISRSLAGQRNIMIGFEQAPDEQTNYVGGYLSWV